MIEERIQQTKIQIQLTNNMFKDIGLEQLQFSLEEKYARILAIFISSKGESTIVGCIDNIFDKNANDVLVWLKNQLDNRYLYKALHNHFKDCFSAIYIEQPTRFLLKFDSITYFISQVISEKQKVFALIEGVISQTKEERNQINEKDLEMQLKENIEVYTITDERKGLFFNLSITTRSTFETLGTNLDAIKAKLESRAEKFFNDKENEGVKTSAQTSF